MKPWTNVCPPPDRQCTATNREGERCKRAPIVGGTVCVLHGGATPVAKAAAQRRLLAMVEPVLDVFQSIVETYHSTRCDKCGKPTGDPVPVIRVGQLVLDRAGFHPSVTVQHEPPPPSVSHLTPDEVVEKLQRLLDAAIEHRDAQRRLLPEAADYEVIDVGPDAESADPPGDSRDREEDEAAK